MAPVSARSIHWSHGPGGFVGSVDQNEADSGVGKSLLPVEAEVGHAFLELGPVAGDAGPLGIVGMDAARARPDKFPRCLRPPQSVPVAGQTGDVADLPGPALGA